MSPCRSIRSPGVPDSEGNYLSPTTKGIALSNFSENWDVTGFLGADLLSDSVRITFYIFVLLAALGCPGGLAFHFIRSLLLYFYT